MTRDTQIQNFPMQANAAAMMRQAVIRVNETRQLDLVCTLHDALYINAPESEAEEYARMLKDCMDRACRDVLGNRLLLGTDISIYTHDDPYWDDRGREQYEIIAKAIGPEMNHPAIGLEIIEYDQEIRLPTGTESGKQDEFIDSVLEF